MTYDRARGRIGQGLPAIHRHPQHDRRRGMQRKNLQESRSPHQETTAQIAAYLGIATISVKRDSTSPCGHRHSHHATSG